jgi:peptidoglycan hydrolase-like protein with peptidoglycan-binding domain
MAGDTSVKKLWKAEVSASPGRWLGAGALALGLAAAPFDLVPAREHPLLLKGNAALAESKRTNREAVQEVQRLLKMLAQADPERFAEVDPQSVDGVLGPNTRKAIVAYRELVNLPPETSLVSEALWNSLMTTHMSITLDPTGDVPMATDSIDPTGDGRPEKVKPVRVETPILTVKSEPAAPPPSALASDPTGEGLLKEEAVRSAAKPTLESPGARSALPREFNKGISAPMRPPSLPVKSQPSEAKAANTLVEGLARFSGKHPQTGLFWAAISAGLGILLITLFVLALLRRRSTMVAAVPGAGAVAFDLEPESNAELPPESDYQRLLREFGSEEMRERRELRDNFLSKYVDPARLNIPEEMDSQARRVANRESNAEALKVGLAMKELLEKDPDTYREIFLNLMFLDSVGRAVLAERMPTNRLDPRINREVDLLRSFFVIHLLELNDRRDIGARMPGLFHFLNTSP